MTHYQILLGWVAGLLLITGCDRLPAQFSESEAQSPEPVAVTPSPVPPVESTPAPTSPVRDPFADA
ncbi:MAG: restriction endonuclease, partial [Synechococcales cyanobacterium T60_A2020_003]|nr:restriction endonuclease [Synechococcales cyanobacterium T60_A2020_003]